MGNVIIVEDDIVISNGLKEIIKNIDDRLNIKTTAYAEEALKISEMMDIDAFFLDIQLKDYSGLKLAKQIRDIDRYKLTPIVFITAIPTREMMAFKEIHCYDYIIKPFDDKEVKTVFSTIINHGIKKKEKAVLKLSQKTHTYILNQDDIIYIESQISKINITTKNEVLQVSRYTLKDLYEELTKDFIRCHRGFIINTKHIKEVNLGEDIILLNYSSEVIPLGRKYKNSVKEKLQ